MDDLDIDRPRFLFAAAIPEQALLLALIKTHPDPAALRETFAFCLDRLAAQVLNSTLSERDVNGFHQSAKVLQAAIDAVALPRS